MGRRQCASTATIGDVLSSGGNRVFPSATGPLDEGQGRTHHMAAMVRLDGFRIRHPIRQHSSGSRVIHRLHGERDAISECADACIICARRPRAVCDGRDSIEADRDLPGEEVEGAGERVRRESSVEVAASCGHRCHLLQRGAGGDQVTRLQVDLYQFAQQLRLGGIALGVHGECLKLKEDGRGEV